MVAARVERVREAGKDAAPVVAHRACLAVQQVAGLADLSAEGLDDRLVAEADAERRSRRAEPPDDLDRDPGAGGPAGTGGDDKVRRRQPLGLLDRDRVVPPHDDLHAELREEVREVVRERVVVVDEQDHRCSASARSIAASTAASLRRHSSCSAAGSESATIPAPACR